MLIYRYKEKRRNGKMKKEDIKKNKKELDGVIETSRFIRDFMLNQEMPFEERTREIKTMRTACEANKTIVSSIINQISLDKLGTE